MSDEASDPIRKLALELGRLPGVGGKSATRLTYYIVKEAQRAKSRGRPSLAEDLARALNEAFERTRLCRQCFDVCAAEVCAVCASGKRDSKLVCVVERPADVQAFETGVRFQGTYHVLHGALAPLDGVGPKDIYLDQLMARVHADQVEEVILATNATVEGDATALYIANALSGRAKVTRLASGIPLGGEIEYLDHATLDRAFSERKTFGAR